MSDVYSLPVERLVLSGLMKFPNLFSEIDHVITENDFFESKNYVIYNVIRDLRIKDDKVDKTIIAHKIHNMGISFVGEIDIHNYIENISYISTTEKASLNAAQELVKLRIRREIIESASNLSTFVKKNGDKAIDEIVAEADRIYNDNISLYDIEDAPKNLFEDMQAIVEELGENPNDDAGLLTPYGTFNTMFGGLRGSNLYAIASRPGQGKTTFLNDIAYKTMLRNDTPCLILDTEMSTLEIQLRMVSNMTGVPLWYIETGNWRRNENMVTQVRAAWDTIKSRPYYHKHVANKSVDQIASIIRRWHLSKVGREKQCLICYDYVKLTGEKMGQNWAEHQAIGDKIDKLKRVSEETKSPIFTAVQLNRSGENQGRRGNDVTDDSSAISLSDRLQWFASFVAIFRRKTQDEMAQDGQAYGSHKLIPLKTRYQGRDATGHQDLVRRRNEDGSNGAWAINYLNFNVENFNLTDRGSLRDVVNNTIPNDHEQAGQVENEVEELLE